MDALPIAQKLLAGQPLFNQDQAVLLAAARRVREARLAGAVGTLLHGRHLALMAADDHEAGQLFRQAGIEMGAQVALVPPLAANSSAAELQTMGRLLSQLYDAVECQGMPAALVRGIAQATTVPVFDGLATALHPTAALAMQLATDPDPDPADLQRLMVQGVLLATVN